MVSIYAIAGIALVLFCIGYGTGFTLGKGEEPNLRGVVAMLIGGVFTAITWGAAVESIRAPGAGATVVLFMAAFGALFLFGLGRFVGSLVLIFYEEGPRRRVAVLLTMGLPAVIVGWILYGITTAEAALQAENAVAREALQAETYTLGFGAYHIQVPGAPVLSLVHPCNLPSNRCTTMFWYSIGWNSRAEAPQRVFAFDVVTNPDTLKAQAAWCARRTDISQDSVWCNLTDPDRMRFKRSSDLRGSEAERETRCNATSTGQIGCAVTHDVASGIVARLGAFAVDEATAREQLQAQRNRAEALWSSMTPVLRP